MKDGHIEPQRSKEGKRQRLRLNATAEAALEQARALARRGQVTRISPFVLINRQGEAFTASGLTSAWRRMMARYTGEPFRFHDLRAKSGSDHATGRHLGHRDSRTLERHYRRRPENVDGIEIER